MIKKIIGRALFFVGFLIVIFGMYLWTPIAAIIAIGLMISGIGVEIYNNQIQKEVNETRAKAVDEWNTALNIAERRSSLSRKESREYKQ